MDVVLEFALLLHQVADDADEFGPGLAAVGAGQRRLLDDRLVEDGVGVAGVAPVQRQVARRQRLLLLLLRRRQPVGHLLPQRLAGLLGRGLHSKKHSINTTILLRFWLVVATPKTTSVLPGCSTPASGG